MRRFTTLSGLLAVFTALGLAGCASSSELPDEPGNQKNNYRSTQDDSESGTTAKSNDETADSDGTRGAGGGMGLAGGGGDSKAGSVPEATGPVAHVNGEPVEASEFNDMISKIAQTKRVKPEMLGRFKSRLVRKLVDRKLVSLTIDSSSVEVKDEEVDKKLDEVKAEFEKAAQATGKGDATLEMVAKKYGISGDDLRDSLRQSIAIQKYLVEKRGLTLPDDDDVRAFYDDNTDKFHRPEQVHLHHIVKLVQGDAKKSAWKKTKKEVASLRKQLTDGDAEFATIAQRQSDGKFSRRGGDLGFQSEKSLREKVDPGLAEAAFSLDKGDVSEPIKSKFGWHLLKVTDRRDAKTVPFEKVKPQIAKRLKNKKIQKELQALVKDLRKDADIETHPDNIK